MTPTTTDAETTAALAGTGEGHSTEGSGESSARRADGRAKLRRLKTAARWAVGLVVLASVGRQVMRTWERWETAADLFDVRAWPLLAAGLAYCVGLAVFGLYNAVIVRNVAPRVSVREAVRAYLLSHPAKYVPGKAMVVIVRVGVLGRAGANPAAASFSAIYETLSMMALGGLMGGALLLVPPRHATAAAVSAAMGGAFGVAVLPWTFGKAVRVLKKGLPRIEPSDCPRPGWAEGLKLTALGTFGWLAWGLSAVLVTSGLNGGRLWPVGDWPRIAGAVMAGTVGGFALPILPGGLGLREGIYHEVTRGIMGSDLAIASALVLRLVWVVGELAAVAVVSLIPHRIPETQAGGAAE